MFKLVSTQKASVTPRAFFGQEYHPEDQKSEFIGHLFMQLLDPNTTDHWMSTNPPIVEGVVTLVDKKTEKLYIGTLHDTNATDREGFVKLMIDGTEDLQVTVFVDHKSGQLVEKKEYDKLFEQIIPGSGKYDFAYIVYDSFFDAQQDENRLTVQFIY